MPAQASGAAPINADPGLESEADADGARFARGEPVGRGDDGAPRVPLGRVVQRVGELQRQKSLRRDQHVKVGDRGGIVVDPIGKAGEETHYEVLMCETARVEQHAEPGVDIERGRRIRRRSTRSRNSSARWASATSPTTASCSRGRRSNLPEPQIPTPIKDRPYVQNYEEELPTLKLRTATKRSGSPSQHRPTGPTEQDLTLMNPGDPQRHVELSLQRSLGMMAALTWGVTETGGGFVDEVLAGRSSASRASGTPARA